MPVQCVYVVIDPNPANDPKFVEIEDADGKGVRVPGGAHGEDLWRIGPLWLRTDDPNGVSRVPEHRLVQARIAANDLIQVNEEHEREAHDGKPCLQDRAGLVAFVAHALGLSPEYLGAVGDALAMYGEHHHDDGDEHHG